MHARALVVVAVSLLAGCAGTGKQCKLPDPPANGAAEVVVFYPVEPGRFLVNYEPPISIDDCIVGDLKYGSYLQYRVAPGLHKIRAEATAMASFDKSELNRILETEERVYIQFRVGAGRLRRGSPPGAHGIFIVTHRGYAESKVPRLTSIRD